MNKLISCSFCRSTTFNGQYYCCDENEISCFGCKEFRCHVCRQRFVKRMEQCYECRSMFRGEHLFGDGYYKLCAHCCRKDLGEDRNRKFGVRKLGTANDKFEVNQFLSKFCTLCNKPLQSTSQANQSKLKQVHPLDNNICNHCRSVDPNMRGLKSPHRDSKGSNIRSPGKTSHEFFDDSIFNRDKQKCKNCDLSILGGYKIIDGYKICSFCLKRSNESEKNLSDSRMKLRSMYSGNELEETKATQSSVSSSNHKQSPSHHQIEGKASSETKMKPMSLQEERQKIKKSDSQEIIQKVPVEKTFDHDTSMKQSNDQPVIQDEVQQKSFNKVKRTQSWNDDIIMEPVADHEYRKKLSKMSEIPETYENQENDHREQITSKGSTEERLMGPTNDQSHKAPNRNIKNNSQMEERAERQGESEPVIIQQQNKKKVKRLESWNDEIILEPVEDHERRKKQKIEEMERSKIAEQDENEEDTQPLSDHGTNYKIGINQPKSQQPKSHNQQAQKGQKSKLHPSMANFTKPEETKYQTADPKDVQSKYSFTSDKLKESRISTKSQNRKSEPSAIDQQNYDRRLRSSQLFNKDKVEETASNSKRTEAARPETSNSYDNRNYKYNGNSNQGYSKLNSPSSAYYQAYDRTKPFTSFPSTTTTTRVINDGTGRYIPTSQRPFNYETIKTTTYRSPQRETYYYSNLPNRQQTSHVYTSPRHNYQETTTSRTSTSNIRESRTQYQSNNENSSRSPTIKTCSSCSNKIVDSSRTFTLNSQPICEGCWESYNKKNFGDEPEMRRSGFYSKYNYY